jgi:mannitol/fructose-specific phosphotransferase system IIA component (Ntr-type)
MHVLLSQMLTPDRVRVPLRSTTKDELLDELVDVLCTAGDVRNPEPVLGAVRERERVLSTGVGSGVAIPHGKSNAVPGLAMAAGVTAAPVDFDALDGDPVRLFFLLVGPDSAAADHVKALSRISRLVRREAFRDRLAGARSAEEFVAIVAEAEAA